MWSTQTSKAPLPLGGVGAATSPFSFIHGGTMGGLGGLARRQHSSAIATPSRVLMSSMARASPAAAPRTLCSSASNGSQLMSVGARVRVG